MAMAGGAKVEVLAIGEVDSETDKDLIHFGILGTSEHFRHSKGDKVLGGLLAGIDSQDSLKNRSSKGPGLL
jgi:hypothetical protein